MPLKLRSEGKQSDSKTPVSPPQSSSCAALTNTKALSICTHNELCVLNRHIRPPKDGLFEVSQESEEYWDVFESMLKKRPNAENARTDPQTGQTSDVYGKGQNSAKFY